FVLLPGLVIAWWRLHRRRRAFNREMVSQGYFSLRRELSQARAIQHALFPKSIQTEAVDFDFTYVPANEVGGDFIHASVDAKGRLDIVVLDVTGHGLASALTVSRLSGEIERLLAEDPDIEPGHVLRMLNRYVNLTLSRHGVYATALCIQADPTSGEVLYANAGHPPAFVRRASGAVEQFDSTTWLLGAAPDSMFEHDQLSFVLGPKDTLVLVTDGVHEAPDRKGLQFGLARLTEALARTPEPERWSQHVASAADQWRRGVGDDDLLVASIRLPMATATAPKVRPRGVDIELDTSMGMGMSPYAERASNQGADVGASEASKA
ncbi:MAG: serine/threonine-protein phosphatase, partial [Phycisphaerae bacterium]|nr:serine/threonine-protein phosphatase [Phycisphaerae bacterium]